MSSAPNDDLIHAYATRGPVGPGPGVSAVERATLAQTFLEVGASAPTLCEGWDAHHLVAHLVLRESNPIATVQSTVSSDSDRAVDDLVGRSPFEFLVDQFRNGPPSLSFFKIAGSDRHLNLTEHFVHHEDVRRAQVGWTRRDLPLWAQDELWKSLRLFARPIARNAPAALTLARSDATSESVARKGASPVIARGLPTELVLYLFGRPQVAELDFQGEPANVEKLRDFRFRM